MADDATDMTTTQRFCSAVPRRDQRVAGRREIGRRLLGLLAMIWLMGLFPAATVLATPHYSPVSRSPLTVVPADTQWDPPVPGASPQDIVTGFDPPTAPWSAGHRGIDLAAPSGIVVAPAHGRVTVAQKVVDRHVVTVEHPNGLLSSFEPVVTELEVGETVQTGDVIGEIEPGVDHCDVSCVHWGVRVPDGWRIGSTLRDRYIDPSLLLGWQGPSVLWPLDHDPPVAPEH